MFTSRCIPSSQLVAAIRNTDNAIASPPALSIGPAPAPSPPSPYRRADSDDNSLVPSAHHRFPAQCPGSSGYGDSPKTHTHRKRYASPLSTASWCCSAATNLGSHSIASITKAQITGGKGRRAAQASNPLSGKWHTTTCDAHQGLINCNFVLKQPDRRSLITIWNSQQLRQNSRSRSSPPHRTESPNVDGLHSVHQCPPTGIHARTASHRYGEPRRGRRGRAAYSAEGYEKFTIFPTVPCAMPTLAKSGRSTTNPFTNTGQRCLWVAQTTARLVAG